MASAKQKRIRERLVQIQARAAEMNAHDKTRSTAVTGADLAEEAAGLGLELADLKEAKK